MFLLFLLISSAPMFIGLCGYVVKGRSLGFWLAGLVCLGGRYKHETLAA